MGCVDTAAEAEKKCRLLPHRDEVPHWRGRSSEITEDGTILSWPAGRNGSKNMKLIPRDPIEAR